jgi:hypothetical protein
MMSRRRLEIGILALLFALLGAGTLFVRHPAAGRLLRGALSYGTGPTIECPDGFKVCGGQCVSVAEPEHGCAADGCDACVTENARARCDAIRMCAVDICHKGFADCDANRNNGCETNVLIDPDHCGGCDMVCPPLAHAERGCGGFCTIWRCESGFRDCDAEAGNGCERDIMNDPLHCGRCQQACRAGQRCARGRCA